MLYTANPCADAERHFDAIEEAGAAEEERDIEEHARLARAFTDAARRGPSAKLEGITADEALYEVNNASPELLEAFFWSAAKDRFHTLGHNAICEMADVWATQKLAENKRKQRGWAA